MRNLAALLVLTAVFGACRPDPGPPASAVAVTFPALAALVGPVAGSVPIIILPAGSSPHAFEPRPSDLRRLAAARITFYADDDLDGWVRELDPRSTIALYPLIPDSLRLPDRHFWLDPSVARALLPAIAAALCAGDASGCAGYQSRARTQDAVLERLDEALRARATRSTVVASGPYLTYFARRFGPDVRAIVEPVEGVEPSPADLHRLIGVAREAGTVVIQPWLPERAARIVAETAEARLVSVDPVNEGSYVDLLNGLADRLLSPARP